jgi:pectate lyase
MIDNGIVLKYKGEDAAASSVTLHQETLHLETVWPNFQARYHPVARVTMVVKRRSDGKPRLKPSILALVIILVAALIPPYATCPAAGQSTSIVPSRLAAFPGAEGFGALASGGRGGEIYHVTNLNDRGAGSFRDAVSKERRIVVFDVGGYINLASEVGVASNVTIAGQTAPGQGVCFRNYNISIGPSHNVIVRYIRLRQGLTPGGEHKTAFGIRHCQDVMVDHVSIEWGRWDCIGFTESSDVTLQYCLIGEGIGPQRFGCLCESDNVTFSHNLWINNQSRNPKAKGTVQYINNVVYNWGVTGYVGGHSETVHFADLINNYFIKGPSSMDRFAGEFSDTDHIFQSGNLVDLNRDGRLSGRLAEPDDFAGPTLIGSPTMKPPVPVKVDSAADACKKVLAGAGDSLHRDAIDMRLIREARSLGKLGSLVEDPAEVGGFGQLKSGPARQIPVTDPNRVMPSGYTAIEEYLNALAGTKSP